MRSKFGLSIVGISLFVSIGSLIGLNLNKGAETMEAKAYTEHHFYVAVETSYTVKANYNRGYGETGEETFTKTGHTYHGIPIYSGSVWDHNDAGNFDALSIRLYNGGTLVDERKITDTWEPAFSHNEELFIFDSATWTSYLVDNYQIKCGNGNYVEMAWDEGEGLPSGTIGQFSATLDITAGQSLTIQKNTGTWGDLIVSIEGNTNNYHNDAVCVSVSQAKIYLKYLTDGTYEAWVPGYTACTVVIGENEYTTTQNVVDYNTVYDTVLVNVDKNQTVKISWNHIEIPTYLNPNSTSGCFSASEGTVTCLLTGAYTFRAHKSEYGETNTLYIVRNDASTANYLATKFNNDVLSKCDAGGNTSQSQLKTAWDIAADHFTNQPAAITSLFVDSSSDAAITRMLQWYRYIIEKYGTSVASDFLNKGYNKASSPVVMALNTSSNATSTIVVVTSLISVCALGTFFFLKKKKENS